MKLRRAALFAACVGLFVLGAAFGASAGTLTNVSLVVSDPTPSAHATVTLSYTTATQLNGSNGDFLLLANLPSGFALTTTHPCGSAVTYTLNGVPGTTGPACGTGHTDAVQIDLPSATIVPAGTAVVVTISSTIETNPSTPGTIPMQGMFTADTHGNAIDRPATQPTVTIGAPAPPAAPTLGAWAMILLGLAVSGLGALVLRNAALRRVGAP